MQLSFPSNKSTEMTFKVGIAGTQTPPQNVAVVLERDGRSLSYTATKVGDDWVALIDNPGKLFETGEVKVCVNVLLHNRLFTPMRTIANIIEELEAAVDQTPPAEEPPVEVAAADPAPEPAAVIEPEVEVAPEDAVKDGTGKFFTVDEMKERGRKELEKQAAEPPKPVKTDEQKRKEVKDLLAKAQEEADKKKAAVKTEAPANMQLLKSIEASPVKKSKPAREQAPEKSVREAVSPVFSMKRTKIVFK